MNDKRYKTCTISCMLVVLKYLKKIKGFRFLLEKKYYKELKSNYIDNVLLSKITYFLAENDIECKFYYGLHELYNSKNTEILEQLIESEENVLGYKNIGKRILNILGKAL